MQGLGKFLETFFNAEVAARYLPDILSGMAVTIGVGLAVTVTGLAAGLALAILRAMGRGWMRLPIVAFVDILRALPPLVLIIIFFFAFPMIGVEMSVEAGA